MSSVRVNNKYRTEFLGKRREYATISEVVAYATGVKEASCLPKLELLFEFKVFRYDQHLVRWVDIDIFARALLQK